MTSIYSEKLEVGYRWYNAHKVEPRFRFGSGLSYTKFEYKNLKLVKLPREGVLVAFEVSNVGEREG